MSGFKKMALGACNQLPNPGTIFFTLLDAGICKGYKPKLWNWLQAAGKNFCSFSKPDTAYKKRCKTWQRSNQFWDNPMPFLASFFDGMSGVKKLPKVIPVKTRTTSAYIPSFSMRNPAKQRMFRLISVRYPRYQGPYIRVLTLFLRAGYTEKLAATVYPRITLRAGTFGLATAALCRV